MDTQSVDGHFNDGSVGSHGRNPEADRCLLFKSFLGHCNQYREKANHVPNRRTGDRYKTPERRWEQRHPLAASSGERITSTFKLSSRSLFGTLSPVKFLRKRSNNGSNDGRMVSKSCNSDIGCGTSASGLDGGGKRSVPAANVFLFRLAQAYGCRVSFFGIG